MNISRYSKGAAVKDIRGGGNTAKSVGCPHEVIYTDMSEIDD
jgi:hypothetical protein